jgi:hypothetical protein
MDFGRLVENKDPARATTDIFESVILKLPGRNIRKVSSEEA